MVLGAMSDLLYFNEYFSGYAVINPVKEFVLEGKLNNDLFQISESDFMFKPPSDWLMLPRRIVKTIQKI